MNTKFASLAIVAALTSTSPAEPAARVAPVGEAVVYKKAEGRELKLYVLKPPDGTEDAARPAIVFFHGGGWVGGPLNQFDAQARHFVSRGMVAVQVEYRLLGQGGPKEPPVKCIQDARSAMRWVRAHAKDLGLDPQRIASAGGSAGGHLAAFVKASLT